MRVRRYQQPAAPAEAAARDQGDGVADVPVGAARHGVCGARLRGHEPRVDRERVAALLRYVCTELALDLHSIISCTCNIVSIFKFHAFRLKLKAVFTAVTIDFSMNHFY